MNRVLLAMNLLAAVVCGGLWWLDASLESRFERKRRSVSMFLPLESGRGAVLENVARLELTLPGAATVWRYVRREDGWHLPQYRDAFARTREIEAILKALLDGRGTMVGRLPLDASHFGLEGSDALEAKVLDSRGDLLMEAWVGRVVPGKRASESFMAARGSDLVLQVNANPWSVIEWRPGARFPPLVDTRVTPLALGRRSVSKVFLRGPQSGTLQMIERRELPFEPQFARDGPRFEWYGELAGGDLKRLNDRAAYTYTASLNELAFDELIGTLAESSAGLEHPSLSLTLSYDSEGGDTLRLGTRTAEGLYLLHQTTTDQVFGISAQKAAALLPDLDALFKDNPAPPAPPPTGSSMPAVPR